MLKHRVLAIDEERWGNAVPAGLGFSGLVLRAQAPGAQVEVPGLAVDIYRSGMNVGRPAPVGVALGVTDVMAEKRRFAA
jgi:hypothetical protein